MTTDQYVQAVLDHMPAATPRRQQIGTELRGHIDERLASGMPLAEVLRQLGDPAALADSYLAEVPLAPPPHGRRLLAKIADTVLIVFMFVAIIYPAAAFTALNIGEEFVWLALIVAVMVAGVIAAAYNVVLEWYYGYTPGKYLCRLRVVRESGARISFGQSIVRQLPVFLQVAWIDAGFILFTDRRQRAFELLSKTRVVSGDLVAEPRTAAA